MSEIDKSRDLVAEINRVVVSIWFGWCIHIPSPRHRKYGSPIKCLLENPSNLLPDCLHLTGVTRHGQTFPCAAFGKQRAIFTGRDNSVRVWYRAYNPPSQAIALLCGPRATFCIISILLLRTSAGGLCIRLCRVEFISNLFSHQWESQIKSVLKGWKHNPVKCEGSYGG